MPSDSVVGFLDRAQANRVLFPEQVEQLIRQPDIPQSDITALCDYLLARGVLTRFQTVAIREARGQELVFAGYPVIDEVGPCPGGIAYKALHPSLRTPVILRRIQPHWLAPDDTVHNYLNRAKSFGMLIHANVVSLLDAGIFLDEPYLVIDQPTNAASLEALAVEVGGAMPGFLAAEYGRVVASTLRMIHERGGVHGEVRPGNLIVGPLSVKKGADGKDRRRPAPSSIIRLAEIGLIPIRPAARLFHPDRHAAPYLPPERLDFGIPGSRGDVYGLGATLYFLLAGRPPFEAKDTNDLLNQVRSIEPISLAALRPDLPREMVGLVSRMMDKHPNSRLPTAADVESGLMAFCRENTKPKATPLATPATVGVSPHIPTAEVVTIPLPDDAPMGEHVDGMGEEPVDPWGVSAETFSAVQAGAEPAVRKRTMTDQEKKRSRMLLILGALLHLTWISLVVLWIAGAFNSTPEPEHNPAPTKKDNPTPIKKNKKQNVNT